MDENFTLVLTPTYDTCMKEFCKVSPASRANDASRDDGDYQIVAKLVVAFLQNSCFFSRVQNHSKKDIRKAHFGLLGSIQR